MLATETPPTVKERPILFSGPMVHALLDGRKTQTRRIIKPQPSDYVPSENVHPPKREAAYFDSYCNREKTSVNPRGMSENWCWWTPDDRQGPDWIQCPYGIPGERLWVRETWRTAVDLDPKSPAAIADSAIDAGYRRPWAPLKYEADGRTLNGDTLASFGGGWGKSRVSIHMPRWASRLLLEVTDIRVERLNSISEDDAIAEGFQGEGWTRHPTFGICTDDGVLPSEEFFALWTKINGLTQNPWVWVVSFKETLREPS